MDTGLAVLAIAVVLVLVAASASPALFPLWHRYMARQSDLEIWPMMRRRGVALDEDVVRPSEVADAIRRCTLCPSVNECRGWLASERREGAEDFCPNERFLQSLPSASGQRGAPHR